ncbi:MAG: prepilin-type N-terminal cleavage/methylation domain-containing protein, partial [Firmicutes bacterium]|nr:prepilin-type N-terminal cleavage/methylation domain-containing protein [Bacillota bacterium]
MFLGKRGQRGFTLAEVMVAVGIFSIIMLGLAA